MYRGRVRKGSVGFVLRLNASRRCPALPCPALPWPIPCTRQAYTSGKGDVSGGGAILVFLPGAPEISRLQVQRGGSGRLGG